MKIANNRAVSVLVAAGVLVGVANIAAYAATGGPFKLGLTNKADQTSTLVNTGNGPALKLKTKPAAPPLAVTSSKKVARLNADSLDGLDSSRLTNRAYRFTFPNTTASGYKYWSFPGLPAGQYSMSYTMLAQGEIHCAMTDQAGLVLSHYAYPSLVHATQYTANASGLVTVTAQSQPILTCWPSPTGSYTIDSSPDSDISFLRVDSVATAGSVEVAGPPT